MKRQLTLIFLFIITIVLARCAPKATTTREMTSEEKVADVKKNYSEEQMDEGKKLMQGNCGKCHKLFSPESRSVEKWENILPSMVKRSKLNDAQGNKVRAYILAHAKVN